MPNAPRLDANANANANANADADADADFAPGHCHAPSRALAPSAALALLALLTACAQAPGHLDAPPTPVQVIPLHVARPAPGWHVTVADMEAQQVLAGPAATVPKPEHPRVPASVVQAQVSAKDAPDDALTMRWHDAWLASLRLEGGPPLDLRPYIADGTIEFDLNVVEMAEGGLSFSLSCGADCGRKLPWVVPSRALAGKGWQHLAVPVRCLYRDGDDFHAVAQPFSMDSSGRGEASIANLRIVRPGRATVDCPDYRTESVSPKPLEQVWSMSWWIPRHEKKLAEIAALRAANQEPEVVFIGDSITHGWEDGGLKVWNQHYAALHALDLGFGGDHTENVLWRLQHGEIDGIHPKVAVLMIGTNNTGDRQEDPRTTAAGIRRLLDELRARLPATRVLLLAIFPRDERPDSRLRRLNDRVNEIISGYADQRDIFFADINRALLNADGTLSTDIMPDLLHPSEKGYALWAEQIAPHLKTLMAR